MKASASVLTFVLVLGAGTGVHAGDKHVVELFTSQGCSSCPAADRLLGEMIESRDDIVALEFHVDYWDDLAYGLAGSWPDPFSDNAYTRRQRSYQSRGLKGNNGVYTPQAVVNGRTAVVGSNKRALGQLLASQAPGGAGVALERGSGSLRVVVSGKAGGTAEVWLYQFDLRTVTRIDAGENKGMTLTNHHVVRNMRRLGAWEGDTREYIVDDLDLGEDQGCAVVIQRPDQGMVLGAGLCPS